MRMTPVRLIAFRLVNLTLCRAAIGDRLLHALLLRLSVGQRDKGDEYCQSADFFTFDQLDRTGPTR